MVSLKVLLLNAENLFLLSDQNLTEEHLNLDQGKWNRLSTSIYDNKPLEKAKALAKIVQETNPDVILLCEVGGIESLQNFNRLFLGEKYSPALIEGNSNRNIDVGYLLRKNMGFYFDIITNKNRPINYLYPHERKSHETGYPIRSAKVGTSHKFSRDVAELHLFQNDREKPFFIFLLTHLKSRLDPDNVDPNGFERRQAELKTLLEIYRELEKKHDYKVPIVVGGDFNGNATDINTDPEFVDIYTTDLKDVCTLAGIKNEHAATFYQVGRGSKTDGKQLDYCFLSPAAAQYLNKTSVQVYRYKDHLGLPFDPPTTLEAKMKLPSDHYPVLFELLNVPIK